jgi:uncharacterized membrane protein
MTDTIGDTAATITLSSRFGQLAIARAGDAATWVGTRLDPVGDATAALETISFLDSFTPSLMPRTSQHQGLAAGLHVLGARLIGSQINALQAAVLGAGAGTPAHLAARAVTFAAGQVVSMIPEDDDETLWRTGVRAGGEIARAAAVSGALYDVARSVRGRQTATGRWSRAPLLTAATITGGGLFWAGRRLRHRQAVIPRWPVEQKASVAESTAVGAVVAAAGSGLGATFKLTRRGFELYFGPRWGRPTIARAVNAAAWAGAATLAYNAAIASIGRANEKVEPAYATPPLSPLVSGSADSISNFAELGQQGRRYVTDVVTPGMIEDVMGEPAVAHPIRTYVGFNSIPLYQAGRAEMALDELERTGAFDRSHLLLVSPTGTGWVDQTAVEAAEFLARGDIATCCVQYGRFPSFLCVQKVGLGRSQFRLLLWGVRQRLRERPPEQRPKVLLFGESLGAWTASDVVMSQGIQGFDHYGVDRALWLGLPALAKWSRNGMATGANELVPDGTVGVFDRHEQLAALSDDEQDQLRAVILSHDNDPIAGLRPELMIREPDWLMAEQRGRNVPDDMSWLPVSTFWQVMVDAANAMVTVPGEFGSFGHDYRGDTAAFVRDAYRLPGTTDEQMGRLEEALVILDLERRERLKKEWGDDTERQWSGRFPEHRFSGGVPLDTGRTGGPRWFR